MAIAPTGAIYKSLIFDGKYSRGYGVYITGEAVFNAPEREVEMISIPGRNGAFALDKGRFNNIEVTYPAGIFADTEADFAEAISEFRNFLCSRKGYVRLQDEYNPNEYRMAVYKSGLEVDPAMLKAGQFNIVFDCKPQRFLTSGETAIAVTSGGTLTNPTLFESSPLLEAEGYGKILFDNGYEIELVNGMLGNIQLLERSKKNYAGGDTVFSESVTFDTSLVETGDTITISGKRYSSSPTASVSASAYFGYNYSSVYLYGTETKTTSNAVQSNFYETGADNHAWVISLDAVPTSFTVGTAGTFTAYAQHSNTSHLYNSSTTGTFTAKLTITISYDGNDTITTTETKQIVTDTLHKFTYDSGFTNTFTRLEASADSSVSIMGQPTYIDCDIGEVYKVEGDTTVSLNRYVDLGSKLPALAVGDTEITYDNTITDLKVVPRWWKV